MSILNKLFNFRGPQGAVTDEPQASIRRVPLPDFGPPQPPPAAPPGKTRSQPDIVGLEALARSAAARLGVKQRIEGFRREITAAGHLEGISMTRSNPFSARLFFNLTKEAGIVFQLRPDAVSELLVIEKEIEAFLPTMMKYAPTADNARKLMDEHEKQFGGTDYFALRGNYTGCYEILSRNLAEKKTVLKSIRVKRAPLIVEIGTALKKTLYALLEWQLTKELSESTRLEIAFTPSGLLTTIWDACESVQSQTELAEKGVANMNIADIFWGILPVYLKDKSA